MALSSLLWVESRLLPYHCGPAYSIFLFLSFKVPNDGPLPQPCDTWSPHTCCYAQSFSLSQDGFLVFCFIDFVLSFSPCRSLFFLRSKATFIKYILCTMTDKDGRYSLCFQKLSGWDNKLSLLKIQVSRFGLYKSQFKKYHYTLL